MGYFIHHGMMLHSWMESAIKESHETSLSLFQSCQVADIATTAINGRFSFAIYPDGSKEGWLDSDKGDKARLEFNKWLHEAYHKGTYIEWVEFSFGDEGGAKPAIIDFSPEEIEE